MATNRQIAFILKARDDASKTLRGLGTGFRRVGADARRMTDDIERTRQSRRHVDGLSRSMDRLGNAARRAKKQMRFLQYGTAMIGGYGVAALLADGMNSYAQFEKQMDAVSAVSRATDAEFKALTETAKQLGATTEFTATQAGSGLEFLARAGFTASQAISAVPQTLDLATAANIDLGRSADIVSNIMSTFGIQANHAARVTDTLAMTNASANTNVLQLSEAMKYAGPMAKGFGVSVEETAAAIGVLGDSGLQGSLAGTGIRMALIDAKMIAIGAHSKPAMEAFKQLGIEGEKIDPDKVGLVGMIENLREAGTTMDQLVRMFGARAAPSVKVMMDGYEKFNWLIDKNNKSMGESARQAKEMRDNLIGDFRALRSAIEAAFIEIGEAIGPALRAVTQFATSVIQSMLGVEVTFTQFAASAGAVATAIEAAFKFATVYVGFAMLTRTVRLFSGVATGTVSVIGRVGAALFSMRKTIGLVSMAFRLLNPIGWATLLLSALWTLKDMTFQWKGETISVKDVLVTLWTRLSTLVTSTLTAMQPLFKLISEGAKLLLSDVATAATDVVKVFTEMHPMTKAFFNTVIGGFVGVAQAARISGQNARDVFTAALEAMADFARQVWTQIGNGAGMIASGVGVAMNMAKKLFVLALQWMAEKFSVFLSGVAMIAPMFKHIPGMDGVADSLTGAAEGAKESVSALGEKVKEIDTAITDGQKAVANYRDEWAKPFDTSKFKDLRGLVVATGAEIMADFQYRMGTDYVGAAMAGAQTVIDSATAAINGVLDETSARIKRERHEAALLRREENHRKGWGQTPSAPGTPPVVPGEFDPTADGGSGSKGSKSALAQFLDKIKQETEALVRQASALARTTGLMKAYNLSKENASQVAEFMAEAEALGFTERQVAKLRDRFVELMQAKQQASMVGTDIATQFQVQMQGFIRNVTDATAVAGQIVQSIGSMSTRFLDAMFEQGKSFGEALRSTLSDTFKDIGRMLIDYALKVMIFKHMLGLSQGSFGGIFDAFLAKGGVVSDNGVEKFAKGGTFTNGIVRKATPFQHAGGMGVMGEAGPEAVMPLTRDASGNLGVRAQGGGGQTVINFDAQIVVQAGGAGGGQGGVDPKAASKMGAALENRIKATVVETVTEMMRPGGAMQRSKG